ncbi:hypothetical protein RYX56_06300 [Alkalihalophilus lindianensis]|uniref:Uncharacterized protein n=1 Tax=Alkalihalophilus lindianensis TaxID=1630542 RepID=A0ABU3X7W7_9BACI|nr:hypothetical protein [Alkalihalophilus lindianensis]MDV2683982.1 hypothetical protein [Alkalihalophilus lindianensis]
MDKFYDQHLNDDELEEFLDEVGETIESLERMNALNYLSPLQKSAYEEVSKVEIDKINGYVEPNVPTFEICAKRLKVSESKFKDLIYEAHEELWKLLRK